MRVYAGGVGEVLDAELERGAAGLGDGEAGSGHEEFAVPVGGAVAGVKGDGRVERGDDFGDDAGLHEPGFEVGGADADGEVVGQHGRGQCEGHEAEGRKHLGGGEE